MADVEAVGAEADLRGLDAVEADAAFLSTARHQILGHAEVLFASSVDDLYREKDGLGTGALVAAVRYGWPAGGCHMAPQMRCPARSP